MCNIRRFTDCESCTGPISTNPRSMEVGEHGLTRGTCSIACRLKLHAVAGLLSISWCVLGAADFSAILFIYLFIFFERTWPAASVRPPRLMYLSTSNEARPRERSDRGRLLPLRQKGPFIPDVGRDSSRTVSRWSRSPGCCGFRGVFWVRRDFFVFFFSFFSRRMHTACCKYEAPLNHLPLY